MWRMFFCTLTPRMQESLVRVRTWLRSFARAPTELAWFTGGQIHRETARQITERAGTAALIMTEHAVIRWEDSAAGQSAGRSGGGGG